MTAPPPIPEPIAVTQDQFDAVEAILDTLRQTDDEMPQWEFCEGFLAALVCCRRAIGADEYLPVLLGDLPEAAQREAFLAIWTQRMDEVRHALDTPIDSLEDDAAYHPEVMDVRGAMAELPESERTEFGGEVLPAFAQIWALGFMYAVETWPEEWAEPSDRQAAKWFDQAMQSIVALTEDDTDEPTLSPFSEDGPASMSLRRLNAFADAVWAVYDLREIWRNIGPRVETLRRADLPGRNDPCSCGSGKKYKKCCGAAA